MIRICCFRKIESCSFLSNIIENIDYIEFPQNPTLKKTIKGLANSARIQLGQSVLAYTSGKNLTRARGLSIYFPNRQIDPTYLITPFGRVNKWVSLINIPF